MYFRLTRCSGVGNRSIVVFFKQPPAMQGLQRALHGQGRQSHLLADLANGPGAGPRALQEQEDIQGLQPVDAFPDEMRDVFWD